MTNPKNQRTFPRYDIEKLSGSILLHGLGPEKKMLLKNVSLSGFQIYSENKITTQDYNLFELNILKNAPAHSLYAKQVWMKEDGKYFRSGFQIRFLEKENYETWNKFILALHLSKRKKASS